MKKLLIASFLFISFSAFSQQKQDTINVKLSIQDLQFVYQLVDNSHGEHKEIKRLLSIFSDAYTKQTADTTTKKK